MLRAVGLLGVLASLFVGLGSLFGITTTAIALAVAIVVSFWSYWSGPASLLASGNARHCEDPTILDALSELAPSAGIPAPPIYVVEDPQPNAFTLGSGPQRSAVILTSALCTGLRPHEIKAVVAHELAHIRNRDVFPATLAMTLVEAILSLAALLGVLALLLDRRARPFVFAVAVLSPLLALVIRCAFSRSAEYRADRDAAELCGGPEPLISALRRLATLTARRQSRTASAHPAMAALFIVDPIPTSWLAVMLSPHPSVEARITRLQRL